MLEATPKNKKQIIEEDTTNEFESSHEISIDLQPNYESPGD